MPEEYSSQQVAEALLVFCGLMFVVNTCTYLMFRGDKRRAVEGESRVPEATLLMLAFFGGWFGAKLAQRRFRHKTRKQPFRTYLDAIPFVWAVILAVLLAPSGWWNWATGALG